MSATAIAQALWPPLRRILKAIGRWIIRRVIRKGAHVIGYYMAERIEVFRARLKRARSSRRKRWLRGRIKRWSTAVRWLHRNARRINSATACALEAMAESAGIPLKSPEERWRAAH